MFSISAKPTSFSAPIRLTMAEVVNSLVDPNGNLKHKIYSGYPTNKQLVELGGDSIKNQTVQFECLEAGQPAYYERKSIYENFEN